MRKKENILQNSLFGLFLLSPFSLLAFINYPNYTGFSQASVEGYIYTLGLVLGFVGIFLLIWQHILGNRYIVRMFLKDLSWSTNLHKKIGIYGTLLIFIHPLAIAYSLGWDLLLGVPDFSTEYSTHVAFGRMAFFVLLFIWVSSAILRSKLSYRPWKYIHYVSYIIVPLVFLHATDIGSTLNSSAWAKRIWTFLIVVFAWIILVRVSHFLGLGQYRYKLVTKKEISGGIFQYTLEPIKKQLRPKPGQFLYFRRGILAEEHPFTISDYSPASGCITVTSKVFGAYTKKMSRMQVNDTVLLDGPYGYFTTELKDKRPSVLVAGGIGITPFLQHALAKDNKHITLFNCNNAPKNVIRRAELKKSLGLRYVDVMSTAKSAGKNIETGYISADIISKYVKNELTDYDFYICGPPAMMGATKQLLLREGVATSQIFTEEFSF